RSIEGVEVRGRGEALRAPVAIQLTVKRFISVSRITVRRGMRVQPHHVRSVLADDLLYPGRRGVRFIRSLDACYPVQNEGALTSPPSLRREDRTVTAFILVSVAGLPLFGKSV